MYCAAVASKMTEREEQRIHIKCYVVWTFLCGNYSDDSEGCSYGQPVISSFISTRHLISSMHLISCRLVWQNIKSPRWLSPPYSPNLVPCDFWLFPKLKSPLKGKRFQEISMRFRKIQQGSWWWLEELCEVPRCLLSRGLRHHCPMYNVSCISYLLQ